MRKVERVVSNALPKQTRLCRLELGPTCAIHFVYEGIDNPGPLLRFPAETSSHRIPSNIIHLGSELFATLIIAQTMIEIALLPDDVILARMKRFQALTTSLIDSARAKASSPCK